MGVVSTLPCVLVVRKKKKKNVALYARLSKWYLSFDYGAFQSYTLVWGNVLAEALKLCADTALRRYVSLFVKVGFG